MTALTEAMDERLRAAIAEQHGRSWSPAVLATTLATRIAKDEPELLRKWLFEQARQPIAVRLRWLERERRRGARDGLVKLGSAAVLAEAGDTLPRRAEGIFNHFEMTYCISPVGERKRIGEMTGEDHGFVAARYGRQGQTCLMLEAFHTALSSKVGKKTTAEVMTEGEYERLFSSITGMRKPLALPEEGSAA